MHFLLVCGRAPPLSNAIRPYPKPLKNCKTLKNAFLAILREVAKPLKNCKTCWFPGRPHPTLSVLISDPRKIPKPGKNIFCCFAGGRKTLEKLQNLEKCIFCCFAEGPNAIQRYPSLSQTLEKIQNLEKAFLQNLEKCIFCWFPGRLQHYPTLFVLILDPRKIAKPGIFFYWFAGGPKLGKIAKPGEMYFLLLCGRAPTLSNAIRPYPRP